MSSERFVSGSLYVSSSINFIFTKAILKLFRISSFSLQFLESQHIENLTTYLQALHKQGYATEDHTTLLLNCYTKLDKTDKLKEFIMVCTLVISFQETHQLLLSSLDFTEAGMFCPSDQRPRG